MPPSFLKTQPTIISYSFLCLSKKITHKFHPLPFPATLTFFNLCFTLHLIFFSSRHTLEKNVLCPFLSSARNCSHQMGASNPSLRFQFLYNHYRVTNTLIICIKIFNSALPYATATQCHLLFF